MFTEKLDYDPRNHTKQHEKLSFVGLRMISWIVLLLLTGSTVFFQQPAWPSWSLLLIHLLAGLSYLSAQFDDVFKIAPRFAGQLRVDD